jgi:hypothetical protein
MRQTLNLSSKAAVIALIAFVLLVSLWSNSAALTGDRTWKGRIDSLPANGLQGEWVVAGRIFSADENTRFHDDRDDFAVGVCVEVEYAGAAEPYQAKKIAKKSSDACPTETPTPVREAFGIIQGAPSQGLFGDWLIGGVAYQAQPGAEFKQRNGPLVIGACAKVHYTGAEAPFSVRKLESRHASDCPGNGTIPPITPTPQPGERIEVYGRIDSFPAELIGDWVVDEVAYTATENTEFKQRNGPFAVDACVKIEAYALTGVTVTPPTIRKIETERDHKCSDDDDDEQYIGRGELYGEVQSFPESLIGEWNIAGITFVTDEGTQFDQRNGAFAVGAIVKVEFLIRSTGEFYARTIETKSAERPQRGHAFGTIESVPDGQIGVWTIGGIDYQVTAQTILRNRHGALEVGARVRVKYLVDSAGVRTALKIETTRSQGGATQPGRLRAFGFVTQMPPEGLVGEWSIDGVVYITSQDTRFKESNGLLGVGAYVGVEYSMQDGRAIAHEIASKVPPGAGNRSTFGVINVKEEMRAAEVGDEELWRIAGVDYVITPATDIDDLESALEVGDTALVNSYVAEDGTLIATQVRGVAINSMLYLPTVSR